MINYSDMSICAWHFLNSLLNIIKFILRNQLRSNVSVFIFVEATLVSLNVACKVCPYALVISNM